MPTCTVLECKNDSRRTNVSNSGISYHSFPKDPKAREKWTNATGRLDWVPSKHSTICSEHFDKKYFILKQNGKKYLTDSAVPEKKIFRFQLDSSKKKSQDTDSDEQNDSDDESLETLKSKSRKYVADDNNYPKNNKQSLVQLLRWKEDKLKKQRLNIKKLLSRNWRLKMKINKICGGKIEPNRKVGSIRPMNTRNDSSSDGDFIDYETENQSELQTRLNTLKENPRTEFEAFGCTIGSYLNSIPLESAVSLQMKLEMTVNKFKDDFEHHNETVNNQCRIRDKHNKPNASKSNKTNSMDNTIQNVTDSTHEIFSRTINRLANVEDIKDLSTKQQVFKINNSTNNFIAYCIQPKRAKKDEIEEQNPQEQINKNIEEVGLNGNVIEVKIEHDELIVKLEDDEHTHSDPLNTC